jgi:hypothetical protein
MGEESTRVKGIGAADARAGGNVRAFGSPRTVDGNGERPSVVPREDVSTLRTEIEEIRDDLGLYITELDRRRHAAFDVKRQFRKHRELALSIGVGLVGLAGAVIAWRVKQARRPRSFVERMNERINETLSDRVKSEVRRHDLLDTLGRAAIGVAAASVASAIKSVMDKRAARAGAR